MINQIAAGDLRIVVDASAPNSIMSALKELTRKLKHMTGSTTKVASDLISASSNLLKTSEQNEKLIGQQKMEAEKGAAAIQQMASSVIDVPQHTSTAASLT
jgi:methyl-accepting chemotaxis protein